MSATGKTSTFVFHHDRCNPDAWTAGDIVAFGKFLRLGGLCYAARLARLGVQLVASETLTPMGGTLEHAGFIMKRGEGADPAEGIEPQDINDLLCDEPDDVVEIVPVYFGPARYASPWFEGDEDEGAYRNWEVFDDEGQARAHCERYTSAPQIHDAADKAGEESGAGDEKSLDCPPGSYDEGPSIATYLARREADRKAVAGVSLNDLVRAAAPLAAAVENFDGPSEHCLSIPAGQLRALAALLPKKEKP